MLTIFVEEPKEEAKDGKVVAPKIKPLTAGCARPVMIHRAMAGSIERFTGILTEHFAGRWPFWLSPRQIMIVPVGVGFYPYAEEVQAIFKKEKMYVDIDLSGNTLQKKIRNAQLAQYNFIFGQFSKFEFWYAHLLTTRQSLVMRRSRAGRSTSASATTPRHKTAASPLPLTRQYRRFASSGTNVECTTLSPRLSSPRLQRLRRHLLPLRTGSRSDSMHTSTCHYIAEICSSQKKQVQQHGL